ncbi:MAG: hypothetical protein IJ231_00385 [Clostridia bacterium]|nr:hypothetical protein [Clostridia bacterium]
MKKLFLCLLACCLLAAGLTLGESASQGVVVKTHSELLFAVNEKKADRILISKDYRHNSKVPFNLEVEAGRTVTILPQKGDSLVMSPPPGTPTRSAPWAAGSR